MKTDGLLGGDFLRTYGCNIDYDRSILKICKPQGHQTLISPLNITETEDSLQNANNISGVIINPHIDNTNVENTINISENEMGSVIIPARSETIVQLPLDVNEDVIINHCELQTGLFLGSTLVRPINGQVKTIILNNTEIPIEVNTRDVKLNTENFKSFEVYSTNDFNSNADRFQVIESLLPLDHCNEDEKSAVLDICQQYQDLFFLPNDNLSCTEAIRHNIRIPETQPPINIRPYRLPQIHREEINNQLQGMLDSDIIRPSKSPWNAPLLIVPKKSGADGKKKWRVVIDFRRLNDVTVGDAFPLPNITDILDQLGKSTYFSTIDLASGFHQIKLDPADACKTAFSSNFQHFEFVRMPFGLKGAPSTFQRLMNTVLAGLQGIRCFVYMDDIVIYAQSVADHKVKCTEIFDRLRENNLKLSPEKCHFLSKKIVYLGHIINKDGISPDPAKISAVKNFPTPKNPREIKSFLGLAGYYHRFIENFAKIAKPMTGLLRKDQPFNWTQNCEEGFEILKKSLTSTPLLSYPDFNKPFIVTTDASNFAVGAILSQGTIPLDKPICYASRTLNRAESRYSTIEKELLAVVYALALFRPYIYGRKITIVTDHKPLLWVMNLKDPSSRLMRWKIRIEEYDYTTSYKKGVCNTNADALSRIPALMEETCEINVVQTRSSREVANSSTENVPITEQKLVLSEDPGSNIVSNSFDHKFYLVPHKETIIYKTLAKKFSLETYFGVIQEMINPITLNADTSMMHSPSFLQMEIHTRTFTKILERIFEESTTHNWSKIAISVELPNYEALAEFKRILISVFLDISISITIFLNKIHLISAEEDKIRIMQDYHDSVFAGHRGINQTLSKIKRLFQWEGMTNDIEQYVRSCTTCQQNKVSRVNKIPMKITTTARKPFEKVFLDIVGPLPVTYKDNRFILTFQDDLTKYSAAFPLVNAEAATVAKEYVTQIICKFGLTDSLLTDQGTNFMSKVFIDVCKSLKINKIHTTAYHPQSNGALERSHRTLAEYLRSYIDKDPLVWDEWIPFAMFAYNTSIHSSTKFTPHELLFGTEVVLPTKFLAKPTQSYNYDNYANEMRARLQISHQMARENILLQKERSKNNYDKNSSPMEFQVGEQVLVRNETRKNKLEGIWKGPFPITEINSAENVTILIKNKNVQLHVNRIKRYTN